MVSNQRKQRSVISISLRTKEALDQIKHPGQSYEGLMQELVKLWKREHEIEETGQAPSA